MVESILLACDGVTLLVLCDALEPEFDALVADVAFAADVLLVALGTVVVLGAAEAAAAMVVGAASVTAVVCTAGVAF